MSETGKMQTYSLGRKDIERRMSQALRTGFKEFSPEFSAAPPPSK